MRRFHRPTHLSKEITNNTVVYHLYIMTDLLYLIKRVQDDRLITYEMYSRPNLDSLLLQRVNRPIQIRPQVPCRCQRQVPRHTDSVP